MFVGREFVEDAENLKHWDVGGFLTFFDIKGWEEEQTNYSKNNNHN